jgi:protein-disulfide isomerase
VSQPALQPQFFPGHSRLDRRNFAALLLALCALLFAQPLAHAQFGAQRPATQVHDSSALHPPAGARVAIVEFGDLECPACAAANPLLMQAAAKYGIPWVRHDILIPGHIWSPTAAVDARWFDEKSKRLGDDYRNSVFANQASIETLGQLVQFTQRFASAHGIALPFAIDPQGRLAAAVQADNALGIRTGVTLTPTIFIVTSDSKGAPYVEVRDVQSQLFTTIDEALADTRSSAPAKTAHK